ncbi:hypothetical protein SAMN05428642_103292 [Flaviramulus basaltis]|uniref:Uncharacterized protein n=1 Tax=Flaviramulus basaltis TaxID=369401 RepID=A0A1K2IPT9_9FLAO|nr:hypothetical protein [Flaviramulus basaltis]SFZ93715.1 hypothetical protein SAMN05428642_103292 [Flaviramulus basaltis]
MPFGESFISTLKSNKSIMLDKSRRFRKTSGGFDWSKSKLHNLPKASPKQLLEIKKRIRKENKQARLKQLIVFAVFIISLIVFFFYFI